MKDYSNLVFETRYAASKFIKDNELPLDKYKVTKLQWFYVYAGSFAIVFR